MSAFPDRVAEELGDILWYVAQTATKFDLDLNQIAQQNLRKTRARWGVAQDGGLLFEPPARAFDAAFPENERLPRQLVAEFRPSVDKEARQMTVFVDGVQMGAPLTDNGYLPDGYRFHDVFHLACAAVLGWSPVVRKLLNRKRRSNPQIDEVEDGGRAIATEEGISALVFAYARDHKWLSGVKAIDYDILKAIRIMTASFEAAVCTTGEWERAILMGYDTWKRVEKNRGWQGVIGSRQGDNQVPRDGVADPTAIALATATVRAWLMLTTHLVTPKDLASPSAPPESSTVGAPASVGRISISCQDTSAANPEASAFATASFAATRPATTRN